MEFKKSVIIIILAIFLFGIASVCAGDVNETELAADNGIGSAIGEDIGETLSADEGTYDELYEKIGTGGNVDLNGKTYTYDRSRDTHKGMEISTSGTIDGNGAVIDMNGSSFQLFKVTAAGVTFKNMEIRNVDCKGRVIGGVIGADEPIILENCAFVNNRVNFNDYDGCGGAIAIVGESTVRHCNFTSNYAYLEGGAIYCDGPGSSTIEYCSFKDNSASVGGAIDSGDALTIEGCDFTSNSAASGSALYSDAYMTIRNSNFTGNVASNWGTLYIISAELSGCRFQANRAKGGSAVYTFREGTVFDIDHCLFEDNTAGEYGAIYTKTLSHIRYCDFTGNTADKGAAIYFEMGRTSSEKSTIDHCSFYENNASQGSAIYSFQHFTIQISNSEFLKNRADAKSMEVDNIFKKVEITFKGGNNYLNAIWADEDIAFSNVTYWGANGVMNTDLGGYSRTDTEAGQNMTVSVVVNGGLVLDDEKVTGADGKIVLDLRVDGEYFIILRHNQDSYYSGFERIFTNGQFYINVTGVKTANKTVNMTAKSNIRPDVLPGRMLFILANGTEITGTYASGGIWWAMHTFDDYGEYNVSAAYAGLDNVAINNATISVLRANSTLNVTDIVLDYGESVSITVTAQGATGITAMIDAKPVNVVNNYTIPISGLPAGNHILSVTTIADADHNNITKNVTVTVNRLKTQIIASPITATYNIKKDLLITLKDAKGNPMAGVKLTVNLNGAKTYVTDGNGQIKVSIKGLTPKVYTAAISYAGDNNYAGSSESVKVTVKKATPKITAKKRTYKAKSKNKKFKITLKDNLGKPMKKVKVRLIVQKIKKTKKKAKSKKVKKKNIKKTNSKGKITFKINRYKKGTYKATVKFYGNSKYNKAVKTVKIRLK